MPFKIIRNDITKVRADAIVNTANPEPVFARGTDQAIYQAAGKGKLLRERKKIGSIAAGEVAVTPAFNLHAKYIIHTVGPVWVDGNHRELELLASCYRKSLLIARQLNCRSIAFPLISTGVYGFPKDKALDIALGEFSSFLAPSDDAADGVSDPGSEEEMDITLVVFDRKAFDLSSALTAGVEQYIDENYVNARHLEEYGTGFSRREERVFDAAEHRSRSLFDRLPFGRRRSGRPVSGRSSDYGTEGSAPPSWGYREEPLGEYSVEENKLDEDFPDTDFLHLDSLQEPFPHEDSLKENSLYEHSPKEDFLKEDSPYEHSLKEHSLKEDSPYSEEREKPIPVPAYRRSSKKDFESRPSKAAESLPAYSAHGQRPEREPCAGQSVHPADAQPVHESARPPKKKQLSVHPSSARPSAAAGRQPRSLQDVISQAGETFQESLLRMIDERGFSDSQVYKRANIDRRLFSKIRSNREYSPKRQTAVSLALALELNMDETRDFLGKAGIALSPSSKFDLIISYCIQNRIYDIIRINAILFDYGQPLLGA